MESVERATGIEPVSEAWEAAILPLNYARQFQPSQDSCWKHGEIKLKTSKPWRYVRHVFHTGCYDLSDRCFVLSGLGKVNKYVRS